jgi:prophage regulatory protein
MKTSKTPQSFNEESPSPLKVSTTSFPIKMLPIKEVVHILGKSRSWVYSKMSKTNTSFDPTFPTPVKLSKTSSLWIESELMAWLESRIKLTRRVVEEADHAAV